MDWGSVLGTLVGGVVQDRANQYAQPSGFVYGQPTYTGPAAQIDPVTGLVKCKRRRRRRLLTESDFNDLMRISTLPNKEGVRIALAKAIGRSR